MMCNGRMVFTGVVVGVLLVGCNKRDDGTMSATPPPGSPTATPNAGMPSTPGMPGGGTAASSTTNVPSMSAPAVPMTPAIPSTMPLSGMMNNTAAGASNSATGMGNGMSGAMSGTGAAMQNGAQSTSSSAGGFFQSMEAKAGTSNVTTLMSQKKYTAADAALKQLEAHQSSLPQSVQTQLPKLRADLNQKMAATMPTGS